MSRPPIIKAQENFVPVGVVPMFEGKEYAYATGFHYRHNGQVYFVTNWHVATGRDPETYKLNKDLFIPDVLQVGVPRAEPQPNGSVNMGWIDFPIRLYADVDRREATWLIHPQHGEAVDVVVVPVGDTSKTSLRVANEPPPDNVHPELIAGGDVFVLGFPMNMTAGGRLPIWKRGSLASEPDFDQRGLPLLYIDTATRPGMSGSPVYSAVSGAWWPEGSPHVPQNLKIGHVLAFLGIYSGRVKDPEPRSMREDLEFYAQIGLVWKERALVEIIEGRRYGTSSFALSEKSKKTL